MCRLVKYMKNVHDQKEAFRAKEMKELKNLLNIL